MRSDFVSSVTHDLKMPLANIRAVADTLTLRPVNQDTLRMYGGHLRKESKRLARLIDNLLAYARVTDVANVYTFEPIVPARLVNDVLQSFRSGWRTMRSGSSSTSPTICRSCAPTVEP